MSGGNIKVVVRCRPLNSREIARGAKELITMEGNQTIIQPPDVAAVSARAIGKKPMTFSFDKSYWSAGPKTDPHYASQQTLYEDLGADLLDHSFEGFNTCIFAYGQTGSGKSYSMMGYGPEKGIIPLTTSELFRRVDERTANDSNLSYTVEVSYIEIYNEKVRDLLNPKNKGNLRVREHPALGPYVEDLSRLVVENFGQMMTLMDEGNKARTVASTNMNETSSRSHAVFTLILTQKRLDAQTKMTGEKVSKISLVDLAGSERQGSTGATGTRLKEGANINKSLTTLGKVIAALAAGSTGGKRKKEDHVPYRDSVLTWLLKESLGGNSKTAMIAAISPADYEETLSTLRYADAAKKIKTHAIVNEDPNAKVIRELKEELELLRSRVSTGGGVASDEAAYDPSIPPEKQIVTYRTKEGEVRKVTKLELQDQLEASEKIMESLNLTWEQKLSKTQAIHVEREKALEEMGISIDKNMVGVHAPQRNPSLVNLNEDPLMSECLIYQIKPGKTVAGAVDDDKAHIKLSGTHILPEHCIFVNEDGVVTIEAMPDARTFVNGKRVPPKARVRLLNAFRVILGDSHVFRFNDPQAVRAERQKLRQSASVDGLSNTPGARPDSPSVKADVELMDWSAARREVADIEKLGDQDLDKLYDDILKVRTQRKRPESRADFGDFDIDRSADPSSNPWAAPGHSLTVTSNSLGTPVGQEVDVHIYDECSEASTEQPFGLSTPASPAPGYQDQKSADVKLHQDHLTRQLKLMAQEVKRVRSEAARARALETVDMEPESWGVEELRKVRRVLERWEKLRGYRMAEEILTGAVDLREANVIAKQMGKQVTYNFLVVDGSLASPASSLDDSNALVEFDDVSNSVTHYKNGPVVAVKVIDWEAKAAYTWDLPKFKQQLVRMRQVSALKQKPNYSEHFQIDGLFTDTPPPSFSFVGVAKVPLRLIASQLSYSVTVPIMCQYTMEAIGSCRVAFRCGNPDSSSTSGIDTPDPFSHISDNLLSVGSKFTFTLIVDTVKGLSSTDYASIHAQTRLSSLVGPSIASEDTFASQAVDLDKASGTHLVLKKTVSVMVTLDILRFLREEYATIGFFAKAKHGYLERLERWDINHGTAPGSHLETPTQNGVTKPAMRRCETDFVVPERHDVLATVSILELSANGDYTSAEVFDDTFQLHQGLQRRLQLRLNHASGKSFPWTKLEHASIGDVRLMTKTGAASVGKSQVDVKVSDETVEYHTDGTSTLEAEGVFDTASLACRHLDKRTPSDQHLVIKFTWLLDVSTLSEPAVFHLDLPIRILGRDARRSSIMTFFSAARAFESITRVYSVECAPPLARSANELWRLDTSEKHVKGEESLGRWKPRSLDLLDDWRKMRKAQNGLGEVAITKVVLEMHGEEMDGGKGHGGNTELLERSLMLWNKAMSERVKVDITRQGSEEEAVARKLRKLLPDLETKPVPTVKLEPNIDNVIKYGPLLLLRDSTSDRWEKLHFVLRRPYLHVHQSAGQRELQVINLTGCHVTTSPEVEMLLERRWAFTVFTSTNSYILQASSEKERKEWMSVIGTSAS